MYITGQLVSCFIYKCTITVKHSLIAPTLLTVYTNLTLKDTRYVCLLYLRGELD